MKVKHVLMIAAVLLTMCISPVAAESVVIGAQVDAAYTITIPESLIFESATEDATITDSVSVEITMIDPGAGIFVSVTTENEWELTHVSGSGDSLSYSMTIENEEVANGGQVIFTDQTGTSQTVIFTLKDSATKSGKYEDTLTFTADMKKLGSEVVDSADVLTTAISNGNSVILTDDVELSTNYLTVASGSSITLDLNGHTLSRSSDSSTTDALIFVKGDLTITGTGKITSTPQNPDSNDIPGYASNTITIANDGNLRMTGDVTVENTVNAPACFAVDVQGGKFTLDGGTVLNEVRTALRVSKYSGTGSEFIMNDGLVKGKTPCWIQLPGNNANDAPEITVTINGGTFQSTNIADGANVLYTYSDGNSHANTEITINGGNFLGGTVSIGSGYKGDAPSLTINGGTFDHDVLKWTTADSYDVVYGANQ